MKSSGGMHRHCIEEVFLSYGLGVWGRGGLKGAQKTLVEKTAL